MVNYVETQSVLSKATEDYRYFFRFFHVYILYGYLFFEQQPFICKQQQPETTISLYKGTHLCHLVLRQ